MSSPLLMNDQVCKLVCAEGALVSADFAVSKSRTCDIFQASRSCSLEKSCLHSYFLGLIGALVNDASHSDFDRLNFWARSI